MIEKHGYRIKEDINNREKEGKKDNREKNFKCIMEGVVWNCKLILGPFHNLGGNSSQRSAAGRAYHKVGFLT